MICPKCKKQIEDSSTVCPYCKKVLTLVCPICGTHNETSTCSNCNYIILSKCASCGKLNKTSDEKCVCGVSTVESAVKKLIVNETFASITFTIGNVSKLSKTLGAKNLLTKFFYKLKSMIFSFAKDVGAYCVMTEENTFVLNFVEDGTDYSSAQSAMIAAVKLLNVICNLNRTLKKELMFSLEARISIELKKSAEFFDLVQLSDKIKLLDLYSEQHKDAKGLQIVVDNYIYGLLKKEYKLESLYSTERKGQVVSYYALKLDSYIVPPKKEDDNLSNISATNVKIVTKKETDYEQELYKKSIEGIKVACKFEQFGAEQILEFLEGMNFASGSRIISLRGNADRLLPTSLMMETLQKEVPCYTVICTEDLALKPWEFFRALLEEIYKVPGKQYTLGSQNDKLIAALRNLAPPNFDTAEDARLAYIELLITLLTTLPQCVIYIENFEYIDIASMRVLEEVFSKISQTKLSFVITNDRGYALQKYMPDLLNCYHYIEVFVGQMDTSKALMQILDNEDFRQSFYYKKIVDNAGASYQYCVHAINYLKDCGIILNFNGKTVLTDSKTVILPFGLEALINTRLKRISKDAARSLVLAYSYILGPVIDIGVLAQLGLNNQEALVNLENEGFIKVESTKIYIQNFETIKASFKTTLKPDVLKYLASNILNKVYPEISKEYAVVTSLRYLENLHLAFSKLYELSIITLQFGDYDTYLKMCIILLNILKQLGKDVPEEEITEYQADFYNNLTQLLYRYAPERIYPIAESLLQRAIDNNDSDKIKTLSNMMLQGGLLTSNYTNSLTLIQNILERTDNCTLLDKQGNLNNKVFSLSLVSMEIDFYLGYYDKCITIGEDILAALNPANFSKLGLASIGGEQFKSHVVESLGYYLLSKFLIGDLDISNYIQKIQLAINAAPQCAHSLEKFADFVNTGNKVSIVDSHLSGIGQIFALLFSSIMNNNSEPQVFAANIYELKKIAVAESLQPYVLLSDLLIGYSYKMLGAFGKAEHIMNNVYVKAQNQSIFFIIHLASYFIADLAIAQKDYQSALQTLTNSITVIERAEHPCLWLLYLLKVRFVNVVETQEYSNIEIDSEKGFISQMELKFPGLK